MVSVRGVVTVPETTLTESPNAFATLAALSVSDLAVILFVAPFPSLMAPVVVSVTASPAAVTTPTLISLFPLLILISEPLPPAVAVKVSVPVFVI